MNKLCSLGAALALSIASTSALSASVTLNFDMTLEFDPAQEVATGAITSGDVLGSVFGSTVGSTGQLPVSVSITYESTSAATDTGTGPADAGYSEYLPAITGTQLVLNGSSAQADMSLIASNSASSDLQWATANGCNGIAPFCTGTPGIINASNGISMVNDVQTVFIPGPSGLVQLNNVDSMSLGLGFTAGSPEFTPSFNTGIVGDISVDGILVEFAKQGLWDNANLPSDASFFDPATLNLLVTTLRFEGAGISDIDLTGTAVVVPEVPIPPAIWLFGSGILWLIGITRRKKVA